MQAGLFSAVTSAFIIEVHSHLQQDPNDETAALLRVLIYKIDNTTFGNNPPALPQWTGPSRAIVEVQAILLASLAASLLSAFLAMLGKQWLNRYASTDMRGTAIERSQNRQRKLDGVVTWYFDYVMEALPLMLQIALLLLGCALSRYLWEINLTVASVVLGVTFVGLALYAFFILAGTASESCPYQTPGARFLRHIFLPALRSTPSLLSKFFVVILPKIFYFILSVLSDLIRVSRCCKLLAAWWSLLSKCSLTNIAIAIFSIVGIPSAVIIDACFVVPAVLWFTFGRRAYRFLPTFVRSRYHRFMRASSPQTHRLNQQAIALDLRCVSWMLQTSLDKDVHLSTLKHLASMMTLSGFDPTLVSGCFDAFIGCIKVDVNTRKVAILQGLGQLAAVSAMCLLRTFHHLSVVDPKSSVLKDVRQRYNRVFPPDVDFWDLPFYYTMTKIHSLVNRLWNPRRIRWGDCQPTTQEQISFTRGVAEIAQVEYQRTQSEKTPRWILRFALHSLSSDPLPPTSVVADCLSIIAIDIGCDVSNAGFTMLGERCVRVWRINITLTLNQRTGGASCKYDSSESQSGSRSWRVADDPIQVEGNNYAPPVRGLAGTKWATRDVRYFPTDPQSVQGAKVDVAPHRAIC